VVRISVIMAVRGLADLAAVLECVELALEVVLLALRGKVTRVAVMVVFTVVVACHLVVAAELAGLEARLLAVQYLV
jgi:hypothetical protein